MAVVIPGMASFMEETKIELEVETTDEAVEQEVEAVEAADSAEEVQEEVAENAEEVAEAEMLNRVFDQCERMEAYVSKYGVDRQFLFMNNMNGELATMLGISLPSCESFDVTGDPKSSTSIACCEGFAEIAKKAWEYIKGVFKKIAAFFGRIWEAIKRRFFSLEANIGRLRKMYEDRMDDKEKLGKTKGTVIDVATIKNGANDSSKLVNDAKAYIAEFRKMTDMIVAANSGTAATEQFAKCQKYLEDAAKEFETAKKKVKIGKKEGNLKKIAWTEVPGILDTAANIVKTNTDVQNLTSDAKKGADDALAKAEQASRMAEEGAEGKVKQARRVASLWSQYSGIIAKACGFGSSLAAEAVKCASQRIAAGSKKV